MALNSAFNKLRATDDLPEVIYAREFDASISNTGNLPVHAFNGDAEAFFTASSTKNKYSLWVNVYGISNQYLNVYEGNDLRVQPNQFFQWEYTHPIDGTKITFGTANNPVACNWYWYDETAILETGIGTKDWNFYRYAETLLSAAECIAQSGSVTSEAANYLAQVKARANTEGKTAADIASSLQTMGKQACGMTVFVQINSL